MFRVRSSSSLRLSTAPALRRFRWQLGSTPRGLCQVPSSFDFTTRTGQPRGGSFYVRAYNVSYTCDEPDGIYIDKGSNVAEVSVAFGDAAPKLYVDALTAPIADQLQVVLEWTHGAEASTKIFAISVELELRDS